MSTEGLIQRSRSDLLGTKGFTLVELLVVIAIVGILASMLLPVLSKAKAHARSTVCKSRLSQIGVALQLYVQENQGKYPYFRAISGPEDTGSLPALNNIWWFAKLRPYYALEWTNVNYHCPGYKGPVAGVTLGPDHHGPLGSYGYNAYGSWLAYTTYPNGFQVHAPPENFGLGSACNVLYTNIRSSRSESWIKVPSEMFAVGESRFLDANINQYPGGHCAQFCGALQADYFAFDAKRHGKNYNQLFCDGRVGQMDPWVLFDPRKTAAKWNYDHEPHSEL